MSRGMIRRTESVITGLVVMSLLWWGHDSGLSETHRSGCHRWHSCPSDHGTYVCGDLGYCSQCPDNQYCHAGQPRTTAQPPSTSPQPPTKSPKPPPALPQVLKVARVIDGDTLKLSTGEEVRLLGVDTPETKQPRKPVQYFGKEATEFTRQLAEGKEVQLVFDPANAATGHKDRMLKPCLLAYVYLADGTFLNAEFIKQGYGFAYTRYPFMHLEQFRQLEREARGATRGLWGAR